MSTLNRQFLLVDEIPVVIDEFKDILGIKFIPDIKQYLYKYFLSYEKWKAHIIKCDPPDEVLTLAGYAKSIMMFEKNWSLPKIKKYLINRLLANDEANAKGVLFEFVAAYHYLHRHKTVDWIPNVKNNDFDLKITCFSGKIVNVECTRKKEKTLRKNNYTILLEDIYKSFKDKINQIKKDNAPNIIVIFIPEEIELKSNKAIKIFSRYCRLYFRNTKYKLISGVSIVSYRYPKFMLLNNYLSIYDTDAEVYSLRNINALNKLPSDFYFALNTEYVDV